MVCNHSVRRLGTPGLVVLYWPVVRVTLVISVEVGVVVEEFHNSLPISTMNKAIQQWACVYGAGVVSAQFIHERQKQKL